MAAQRIAESSGVRRHVVVDIDLRVFGGSALTSDVGIPKDRDVDVLVGPVRSGHDDVDACFREMQRGRQSKIARADDEYVRVARFGKHWNGRRWDGGFLPDVRVSRFGLHLINSWEG